MTTDSFRSMGLVFIGVLVVCLALDFATSDTLSFIRLVHTGALVPVIQVEDLVSILTFISLIFSLLGLFFASHQTFRRLMVLTMIFTTTGLFFNVAGLLRTLTLESVNPVVLLLAAAIVYISNILVFSVWYWLLDYPSQLEKSSGKSAVPVLIFPQNSTVYPGYENWTPGFVDYLFLSFHTSSTVGPTDTLVLSKRAKIAMICQVTVSLIVLVMLAARAIGILK